MKYVDYMTQNTKNPYKDKYTKKLEPKTKSKGWKTWKCCTSYYANESGCHDKINTQQKRHHNNGNAQ